MPPARPPWPSSAPAAISITLDNLAEAADLHRGLLPPSAALGSHPSLTLLPKLLAALAARALRATYFIEGWNARHYPAVLARVRAERHEVALHAWMHEVWATLDEQTERANLDRSVADFATFVNAEGEGYKGFRPPGGGVTARTLGLLRERGFGYVSPAAERCAVVQGVAVVPFGWRDVDAYYYMESTRTLRERDGEGQGTIAPEEMKARMIQRIDGVMRDGGYVALLFHPFLTDSDERLRVVEEVLDYVVEKQKEGLWVATCKEVAEWVTEHEEEFGSDPGWDTTEWKKK